jgi:hypothetical protein
MNSEHYIDGQHNGGVYNSFNQAVYSYCYQNPIKYIDPNGKQTNIVKPKKTAMQRAYNPKTGNTDIGLALLFVINDFIEEHNTYKPKNIPLSHEDITSSVKSAKGGDENIKTDGNQSGDIHNVDVWLDYAPGSAKDGNKYAKTKDILIYLKDAIAGYKKGDKAAASTKKVIIETYQTVKNADSITETVTTYQGGYSTKEEKKAIKKDEK